MNRLYRKYFLRCLNDTPEGAEEFLLAPAPHGWPYSAYQQSPARTSRNNYQRTPARRKLSVHLTHNRTRQAQLVRGLHSGLPPAEFTSSLLHPRCVKAPACLRPSPVRPPKPLPPSPTQPYTSSSACPCPKAGSRSPNSHQVSSTRGV